MNGFYMVWVVGLSCLASYLVGSIPFGLLLGKAFGVGDIRKIGSGNIGATNMLRTGNKPLAAATLMLDFMKGIIGISVAQGLCDYIYHHSGDIVIVPNVFYLAGVAAVLGHVFPVWLRFKGGKGVATTLGVFLVTNPPLGAVNLLGWLMMFYLTRVSALAAIGSIACTPVLGLMYGDKNGYFFLMSLTLAILVIVRHKDNIIRLRQGTETKWEKKDGTS